MVDNTPRAYSICKKCEYFTLCMEMPEKYGFLVRNCNIYQSYKNAKNSHVYRLRFEDAKSKLEDKLENDE